MKKQDTEAKLKKLEEKLEAMRNENHNLKRQVKRLKESKRTLKEGQKAERLDRSGEVLAEGVADIKKKLRESGLEGKTLEVAEWFVSQATGSPKK